MPSNHAVKQKMSVKLKEVFSAGKLENDYQGTKGQMSTKKIPTNENMPGINLETFTKEQHVSQLPHSYEVSILAIDNGILAPLNNTKVEVDPEKVNIACPPKSNFG